MTLYSNIFKNALLLSAFFFSLLAYSQRDSLELIKGAEELILEGSRQRYLLRGKVQLKQNDDRMFCDSAYYYYKSKHIYAYGNVHLNKKDTLNLFCDSLFYNSTAEYAKLWGNVRLRDNEFRLNTDSMVFDTKKFMGSYSSGGVITNSLSNEKLTSRTGTIFPKTKNFFFGGNVKYTSNDYIMETDTLEFNGYSKKAKFHGPTIIKNSTVHMYCENGWYNSISEEGVLEKNAKVINEKQTFQADSIYYNNLNELVIGNGHVQITDSLEAVQFFGDYAKSSEIDQIAFLSGNALIKKYDDINDTLFIRADSIFHFKDEDGETNKVDAFYTVSIFKNNLQGVCDSLSYIAHEGIIEMFEQPFLWLNNAQLSSDTIIIIEKNDKIDGAILKHNALTVNEVDSLKYYDQISGKNMFAFFKENKLQKIDVTGNAKSIYFIVDKKENDSTITIKQQGMNRIYSSDITIHFNDNQIQGVTYRSQPEGVLYPMNQLKADEIKVEQFKWEIQRKPSYE